MPSDAVLEQRERQAPSNVFDTHLLSVDTQYQDDGNPPRRQQHLRIPKSRVS